MRFKIFTVIADESFMVLYAGPETRTMTADSYLEHIVQSFLDDHPGIAITHVQYATSPIIFGSSIENSTGQIEKTLILFYTLAS